MSLDPARWVPGELDHLGDAAPQFHDIFQPAAERDAPRLGVTHQFLEHAADYDARYANLAHFRVLLADALARVDPAPSPAAILDIGSGAGNTVLPLLERFPNAIVVATDISPQLLAILRDRLTPEQSRRTALLCVDAARASFRQNAFDLAVGGAILHHVLDPKAVIDCCARSLRARGAAIFFEPFELGHALLRVAYAGILREAAQRGETGPGLAMLQRLHDDYVARAGGAGVNLEELDDKWMFTRGYFERLAREGGWAGCTVYDIQPAERPLVQVTEVNLRLGAGLHSQALPEWAWARLREVEAAFSAQARRDAPFECAVVLQASVAQQAHAQQAGWWYEPAHPGRGFFMTTDGSRMGVLACHYDGSGAPVWHSIAVPLRDVAEGNDATADPGTMRPRVEDETHVALEWAGERIDLEPQHPGSPGWGRAAGSALGGMWIEDRPVPGCAVAVEYLDGAVFAALLDAREWRVASAACKDPRRCVGEWLRFAGGQSPGGPYRPPGEPQREGEARLTWTEDERLLVKLPGGRQVVLRRYDALASPLVLAP
jgi:ubiquinone/menaquinone biosynthesis C-methylase UbiE